MRKLILAIVLSVLFANPVFADYMNSKGGGGGSSTNTNIFTGANQATLTGFNYCSDVVVSPDGLYTYNIGILASNSDVAVVKVKISDGSIVSTRDLLVAATGYETAEIDSTGANLYAFSGVNYWKIDASALTITHTAAITGGVLDNHKGWDLSPNGATLAYVNSNVDQTVHLLNTTTFAVTNRTLGHSAGAANTYAVGFLDNTNIYAAYLGVSLIDQYTTAGAWVRAVDTTDANVREIRAGVNGNLFILGTTQLETVDTSHNVTAYPYIPSPSSMSVDKGAVATSTAEDLAIVIGTNEDRAYILDGTYVGPSPVSFPAFAMWNGTSRVGMAQDGSGRGFIASESSTPVLVSLSSDFVGFAANGDNRDITSVHTTGANIMTAGDNSTTPLTVNGKAGSAVDCFDVNVTPGSNCISVNQASTVTIGATGGGLVIQSNNWDNYFASLNFLSVGKGPRLKSGSNALVGSGTLSGGSLTVTTTAIDADDIVILTGTGGTVTNLGVIYEDKASRVNGTSFTVKSSNVLDTSDFSWVIQKVD